MSKKQTILSKHLLQIETFEQPTTTIELISANEPPLTSLVLHCGSVTASVTKLRY